MSTPNGEENKWNTKKSDHMMNEQRPKLQVAKNKVSKNLFKAKVGHALPLTTPASLSTPALLEVVRKALQLCQHSETKQTWDSGLLNTVGSRFAHWKDDPRLCSSLTGCLIALSLKRRRCISAYLGWLGPTLEAKQMSCWENPVLLLVRQEIRQRPSLAGLLAGRPTEHP